METRSPLISSPYVYNLKDTTRCKIYIWDNLTSSEVFNYDKHDNTKTKNRENERVPTLSFFFERLWAAFRKNVTPFPHSDSLLLGSTCSSSESETNPGQYP